MLINKYVLCFGKMNKGKLWRITFSGQEHRHGEGLVSEHVECLHCKQRVTHMQFSLLSCVRSLGTIASVVL